MSHKILVAVFSLLIACGTATPAFAGTTGKPHKPHVKKLKKVKKPHNHHHRGR